MVADSPLGGLTCAHTSNPADLPQSHQKGLLELLLPMYAHIGIWRIAGFIWALLNCPHLKMNSSKTALKRLPRGIFVPYCWVSFCSTFIYIYLSSYLGNRRYEIGWLKGTELSHINL